MTDLGAATWSEVDASNNATPPAGWPEGMFPSDVNNSARANMGAEKRWWDRSNPVFTTAGTTTAYTLTYTQAATAYYDGEVHSFVVNATCGVAPTLNINGLGARPIWMFGGPLLLGCLIAGQIVSVRYNLANLAFDLVTSQGWNVLSTQAPAAIGLVDFAGIPIAVNHLQISFDVVPATNNVALGVRFYNSAGVLDTGAAAYSFANGILTTVPAFTAAAAGASSINPAAGISNAGTQGCSGDLDISNIQGVKSTQCNYHANWLDQTGAFNSGGIGYGFRIANGNITGVRLFISSGNAAWKTTLRGSV